MSATPEIVAHEVRPGPQLHGAGRLFTVSFLLYRCIVPSRDGAVMPVRAPTARTSTALAAKSPNARATKIDATPALAESRPSSGNRISCRPICTVFTADSVVARAVGGVYTMMVCSSSMLAAPPEPRPRTTPPVAQESAQVAPGVAVARSPAATG